MPKRIMEGVVVSTKQDKTAVVRVSRTFLHPLLKKIVRRTKKYHAHDEANAAEVGQTVSIVECAPRSKLKRWELMASNGEGADA
ncbi:MAG: 30S ribosomal protein S17 [Pseudomonadota bacterium]